jgi:BASS family bile acid:Na+ symporter
MNLKQLLISNKTTKADHIFHSSSLLVMKRESIYNLFYFVAAALLSAWIFISIKQLHNWGGWLLMLFFLSIAFAFRGSKTLKGLSYTMMIMAAVSIAMYHPQYFKTIGDYKLSALIIPLLQIIMFGMGTELSLKDFANVIRMPKE